MVEIDKEGMGRRIREIRLAAGLRQWELARRLGTTQSAVHKYEHGVVPEPRRLVEIARIGGTSVEWVLTGTHWENGSPERTRLAAEVLETAALIRSLGDDERERIEEALGILRDAVRALDEGEGPEGDDAPSAPADGVRDHGRSTLKLLEAAWRIQRSILRRVAEEAERRIGRAERPRRPARPRGEGDTSPATTPR